MATAGVPAPPLVSDGGGELGTRRRLRGPQRQFLREEYQKVLDPVPTTVNDNGAVRFGDSLLLLNHGTEVLLQADTSRQQEVVDDSHSQRKQFLSYSLTTGKVLHPCARNCFTVVRVNRDDGFGEGDLEVHYGQHVRILASSFLRSELLYLHLEDAAGSSTSLPVLLPRAAKRTVWRVMPLGPRSKKSVSIDHARDRSTGVQPTLGASPVCGQVVRINEQVVLENVQTGRRLMSDSWLINSVFGVECRVFAEEPGLQGPREGREDLDSAAELDGRHETWSFVNDTWVDAVSASVQARTGGLKWKDDEGDDFEKAELKPAVPDASCFAPQEVCESESHSAELSLVESDPRTDVCQRRIFPTLRSRGMHFIRRMRNMCEEADVRKCGELPARVFEGILVACMRLTPADLEDLCEVFPGRESNPETGDPHISYRKFFWFLEGVLPEQRLDCIRRAYRKLRGASRGDFVNVECLIANWNPECLLEVRDGTLERKDAYEEFLSQWHSENADGHIPPEEFLRYYRDVSMSFEDSDEFVGMMRIAWDL